MPRPKILVVDDEPFNIEIVVEYLSDCDYDLVVARDGEQALALLADPEARFDLVVLDRMMPGIDGIEVLRRMKREERLQAIPVIMQTAAASPERVREGLAAGAHYYLTKPFEADSLITVVRTALQDRSRRAELVQRISEHTVAMRLVERIEFCIRTLEEAAAVAVTAAQVAPRADAVAMGLAELLVNGIEHGNLGIDFTEKGRLKDAGGWSEEIARRAGLPENRDKRVRLVVQREASGWSFLVQDDGPGFDWRRFIELEPERAFAPNGRGIVLARQIAFSRIEYSGNGNTVNAWVDSAQEVAA